MRLLLLLASAVAFLLVPLYHGPAAGVEATDIVRIVAYRGFDFIGGSLLCLATGVRDLSGTCAIEPLLPDYAFGYVLLLAVMQSVAVAVVNLLGILPLLGYITNALVILSGGYNVLALVLLYLQVKEAGQLYSLSIGYTGLMVLALFTILLGMSFYARRIG